MAMSYYELLGVSPSAPLDEIKKAFRREIAKYHPDKVQHLGREFQEIAAVKAAELTQAYKTLSDETRRAEYDAGLASGSGSRDSGAGVRDGGTERWRAPAPNSSRSDARPATATADRPATGGASTADRVGVSDLLRKAALARFRQAISGEFGRCDETPGQGFDLACAPPKGRFWSKAQPRILARIVAQVDAAAVAETWGLAARLPRAKEEREVCVFLMGPAVAPAGELARAIAGERRKPAGLKLFLVPVNTRSWAAHIPADAPAVVKALVTRLKSA